MDQRRNSQLSGEKPRSRPVSRREFLQAAATVTAARVAIAATPESKKDSTARKVIPLNGTWKIYFDEEGRWKKPDWISDFLSAQPRTVTIQWEEMRKAMEPGAVDIRVPATWEEYRPNTRGEAWYWRDLSIPEDEGPRATRLIFNAVRYGAEVFLDGHRVALYLGGYTPFTADLAPLVRPGGTYQLAVHVVNPGGGEAGAWEPMLFEGTQIPQSHNFGGIWQDVDLITTSRVCIEDIFVEPRLAEKTALAHVVVRNRSGKAEEVKLTADAHVRDGSGQSAVRAEERVKLDPYQDRRVPLPIRLDPLKLWEPTNPIRYRVEVTLQGTSPAIRDRYNVDFGMREFTVRGRFFYLNGRKFMVKSAINHQYYPITVGYPPTLEFARKEIGAAQKAGLNMMHIHRQVGHPLLLEGADESGLLLYEEPGGVIFDESHDLNHPGIQLLLRQASDLVVRDRNHPALVAWGMANENTLDPDVTTRLMQTTRKLDPTRVVCDNSGMGAMMLHPYEKVEKPWRDFHFYPPAPIDHATYQKLADGGHPPVVEEGPQIVGEVGYGGLPDIPAAVKQFALTGQSSVEGDKWAHSLQSLESGFKRYGLKDVFGSVTEFCRQTQEVQASAVAEMVQALRTNSYNSGYAVSCFHDLAIWYCGITDLFRDPKLLSTRLARVNSPLFLALYADPAPNWTNAETRIRCLVINEDVISGTARLRVSMAGPGGERVFSESRRVTLEPERSFLLIGFDHAVKLAGESGHYIIRAELEADGGRKVTNERSVFALNPTDTHWPEEGVVIYDPNYRLLPFLSRRNWPYRIWSPGISPNGRPILVAGFERWYYYENRQAVGQDINQILKQCRDGAQVVFLISELDDKLIDLVNESGAHPQPLKLVNSGGHFQGCFHWVKPHGLFAGLPTKTCMNAEYRNVSARISLDGFEGESVAGCNENAYWWGTDIGIIRVGAGHLVLSTMRLTRNLGFGLDPVAERIIANFVGTRL